MRILIVAPLYPPDTGRLATYIKELATRLAQQHQVSAVVYGSEPESVPDVQTICTNKHLPILLRTLLFTWRLWRAAKGAELLYVSDGASVGLPSILVGSLRRVPVYRFVREDEARERLEKITHTSISEEVFALNKIAQPKIRLVRVLQSWVLRRAKRVLMPSGWLKDVFTRAYQVPAERMVILPYPPERLETLPFTIEPQPQQILVVSPLTATSGVKELIELFPRLQTAIPLLKLVIANTGPEEASLRSMVAQAYLQARIQFLGNVSRVERAYLLQTSGALILNTTAPDALHDLYAAYAARLPVVTLATLDTLPQVLSDQELRTQLIEEGIRSVHEQVGWDHHLEQLLRV